MRNTGQRALSVGLAAVLMLSVSGVPRAAGATAAANIDEQTEALQELQAELDALFAPDPDSDPDRRNLGAGAPSVGAPMQAASPVAAPVVVTSIALVEANATVTLEWADVGGIGNFEVLRDRVSLDLVREPNYEDTVPAGESYVYEIRAVNPDDSRPTVGTTTVAASPAARGCDHTWTGAVDGEFADADNWAPIGAAPSAPSVPKDPSHICIDSRQNTPATSTDADAGVGTVTTSLRADDALPRLLDIAGGDFTVSSQFAAVDLAITGGGFASTGTTTFRLLDVADGELILSGNTDVSGGVDFGPGAPSVRSTDGSAVRFNVGRAAITDATLTLDGQIELAGIGLEMNGTSSVVPGGVGSTMTLAPFVPSGTAQIDVSMTGPMTVVDGAALTISNHQAIAAGTRPPQAFVGGTLTLTQPVTRLGDVDLFGVGSAIELNGGRNVFAGLQIIDNMTLDDGIAISVPNDLQIRSLSMNNGATFTVGGVLDYTSFLSFSAATVTAPTIITTGTGVADGDIDVFGTANRIVGDVTTNGSIRLASDPEVGADAKLVIDGGLTLGPDSFIDTSLTGSDVTGRLAIRDAVALDGALLARITGVIPADTDVAAISWGSATGTIAVDISGNTDGTTIEQKTGGVFVQRDGGGPGLDITAVAALGMLVDAEGGTQLTVGWPAVADADRYVVFQDGDEVGDTTDAAFVADLVDVKPGDDVVFSVIAILGEDEIEVGSLTLTFPAEECTIAWTGAIDDAWSNPLNWLPISTVAMPSPRAPESADDVCVDTTTNTPIIIDGDVSINSLTSAVPPGGADPLIDVASGDVAVSVGIDVPGITVRAGSITSNTLVADELVLGNAVVDATTSEIGALAVRPLGEGANDAELLGAATIDRVTQRPDTTLRIEDLQSPATTVLDLAGPATLDKSVTALGELYLFEAGSLSVGGSAVNVLDGLTEVGILGVQGTLDVTLPENIVLGDVILGAASVEALRDLSVTGRVEVGPDADLVVDGDFSMTPAALLRVSSLTADDIGEIEVAGTANLAGALEVDLGEATGSLPFFTWLASTGSFANTSLSGVGAAGRELIVDATGVRVELAIVEPPALIVVGFDVRDGLGDVELALNWPTFDGAASYQIRRDDAVVTAVPGTTVSLMSTARQTENYAVVALDDDLKEIGVVGSLDLFAGVAGCNVAWTGAVDDSWHQPLNWAPVVSGGFIPVNAVPVATDLACLYVESNLPAQVTTDVEVAGLQSLIESRDDVGLSSATIAVEIVNADFATTYGIDTTGMAVRDGVVDLGEASTLERVELSDGTLTGGSLSLIELASLAGDNAISVESAPVKLATVAVGSRLVTAIADLGDTTFEVAGRLELLAPGDELDGLTLQGPDAEVVVDAGETNVLTGFKTIDVVSLSDVALAADDSFTTLFLGLDEATLTVEGDVDIVDLLAIGQSQIVAETVNLIVDPDGLTDPFLIIGNTTADSSLMIDGDLSLDPTSTITILVDELPTSPLVEVTGSVALDGAVTVNIATGPPAGSEQALITWGTATGTTTNQITGAAAAGVELVQSATGLSIRSIVPLVDQLVALGIELGEKDSDPSLVSLTWPMTPGATSYEIERNGTGVAATMGTTATISDPSEGTSEYTVVAIDDGKPLGTVGSLAIFAPAAGCDVVWTGAIDDDWAERLNWTPVVFAGDSLPAIAVPDADDFACIATATNLPVQVDTNIVVGSIFVLAEDGDLDAKTEAIAVNGATVTVTNAAFLASATLTDATLSVGLSVNVAGDLTFADATLESGGPVTIDGALRSSGPNDQVRSASGNSIDVEIDELIGRGSTFTFIGDITSTIRRVDLVDTSATGGKSAAIGELAATSGTSEFSLGQADIRAVDVAPGAVLVAADLTGSADTLFEVAGRLALPAGTKAIGELTITGPDAAVTIGAGRDNDLTDVTTFGAVSVTDNDVAVGNDVRIGIVLLSDASIVVSGELTATTVLTDGTSAITATSLTITGDGVLTPGITAGNSSGVSTLSINGDLSLSSDSQSSLPLATLPSSPLIVVWGSATLAGTLTVSNTSDLDGDTERALVRWANATGTWSTTLIGSNDKQSLRQRDAGLFLVSIEVEECGDTPQFAGMDVEGCWVDNGDDTYTANRVGNVDGVAIGGVQLALPTDDTTITIDVDSITIGSSGADGNPAPVAVSIPVTNGTDVLTTIPLGNIEFDELTLGEAISFPLPDLLGFPIATTPTLTSSEGGWNLGVDLNLPGLLSTAGLLDLSIGAGGILSTDLSLDDLSAVFGDLAGITDLDIDWADASTWLFSSGGLGGPSITGDIDFDELDGGGTLSVRDLRVDDVLVLPDFDLTGVFTDTSHTWIVEQPSPSVLRRFGFSYTTAGALISAEILLGDEAGETGRNSVASWGEWLDIDAFEFTWNGAEKVWDIAGRLTNPELAFTGSYSGDGAGGTVSFDLNIVGAELGPFATIDLDLAYNGVTDRFDVTAFITRDGELPIDGAGFLRFDDGSLAEASLTFATLSIGELTTIADFSVTYLREEGSFTIAGILDTQDGSGNEVSGSLTFADGRLSAGQLRLDALQIGPISFEELAFDFSSTGDETRVTSATISGLVQSGSREATPVTGDIIFVDGTITFLELTIGTIGLGGFAQIDDISLSYSTNAVDGSATISGAGQLVTSDGITDTPVLVEITIRDGRVVDGRIEADVLSFGQAITIEDFTLVNSPIQPGVCAGVANVAGATQWQVSGNTTSNGQTTAIDGCLAIDGDRVVAGSIELGNLRLGGLMTIENLEASFATVAKEIVIGPDGEELEIARTDMTLSATATVDKGAPRSFSGSASFANGGLIALDLSLPDLDLMNVVRLRNVEFAYVGGTPWDADAVSSYSLSGQVVGENTTSSFAGDVVFDENGEVEALSIDATDIDFGVFRLDVLSFSYDSADGENTWSLAGQVTVDGKATSIAGEATFDGGQVISADLTIEQLVIGDLAVLDVVTLSYLRAGDGSESWNGSAEVTFDSETYGAGLGFGFDADGSLTSGFVEITRLQWSDMLVFNDVRFSYASGPNSTRWDVSGSIDIDGEATSLSGFVQLEAGRVTSGQIVINNLRLGQIATIEQVSLAADVSGDTTTWVATLTLDNKAGTTGTGEMTWTDGRLTSGRLDLANIRFGSLFELSELSVSFAAEVWSLSAQFANKGEEQSISSVLGFDDGRLMSANLDLQNLSFGDVVVIDELSFAYLRGEDERSASWSASATVTVGDRTTSVGGSLVFVDNQLRSAVFTIGELSFGEVVKLDGVTLTYDRDISGSRWRLNGAIVIDGETTTLSGSLDFSDGRLIAGGLTVDNLRVGPLATIDELSLTYLVTGASSRFDASITFADGSSATGFFSWVDGRLDQAGFDLGTIDFGTTFSLVDAEMGYRNGEWTFSALFTNNGNEFGFSGGLTFLDGRLVDGRLDVGDVSLAGFSLTDFALVLGGSVELGGGSAPITEVCGVTDPGGAGEVYGIVAGIVNESGNDGSFGGRLRVDGGSITDGVLCASNIDIGEIITIDEFLLRPTTIVAGNEVRETWTGSIELSNPSDPSDPFEGSFEWVLRGGRTTSVEITASRLRLSELLALEDVSFSYDRTVGGSRWTVAARLERPNSNPGVSGYIDVAVGRVVAAELSITNLSFGNVLSLNDLTMTYVGRRAQTAPPAQVFDNDGVFPSLPTECGTTPDGSNVPSGPPSTTGAEAYFRVNAEVGVGASAVAAAGSIGFVDGKVSMFDVSISCLNLGDWLSLDDVRIGLSDQGDYLFQAAQGDATESNQRVTGRITMDDGRVVGGRLEAQNLSLGFVELQYLRLTVGQQEDGTSTWGAEVAVYDLDGGSVQGGNGSLILDAGQVIGGSLELPDLPVLDLLPVRDVTLGLERLDNGNLRVSGGATFIGPDDSDAGVLDVLLVWGDGALQAGSIRADDITLFNVVDGASLAISYARVGPANTGPRWSGAMNASVPGQSGSSIAIGVEVINGRVDSGTVGFDGNGDGNPDPLGPDGEPPATGNGKLGDFPLKALHLRFCADESIASYCADVDGPEWDGRLKVQLPTDNAPSLDAQVTIRNGRFVRAALDLEFSPGIMVFSGLFLDSIGGALELDPRLRFCGSAGLTAGSQIIPIARIEGSFQFSEEFSGANGTGANPPRNCTAPPAPFDAPDGVAADYYRFLIQAEVTLFPGNPLGIDLSGTGYIDLWTSGYLGVGAQVSASIWGNKLAVNGMVEGSVFDANSITTTNPKTGQPLTGVHAQLSGSVAAIVLGKSVASADFLVNTVGWSGCTRIGGSGRLGRSTGVSGYWSGGRKLGCDVSRVRLVVPGSTNFGVSPLVSAQSSGPVAAAFLSGVTSTADTLFEIEAGEDTLGLIMRSSVGTPNTLVIAPNGRVFDVSNDFGDQGPLTLTDGNEQIFIIENPAAGTWTVRQVAGSPVLEAVEISLGLPDVEVAAQLEQGGDALSFDYSVLEVAGQSVSFVERDSDGAVINLVGRVETKVPSASAGLRRVNDPINPVRLESLAAAGTTTGTVSYRTNAAAGGGEYQLVALVAQDGLPREEVVLATYQVAPATRASAPTSVTATATADGASVSWEPPTDDGGRQIMAYHVSSERGFIVAVDGDDRSVELPIPLMTPGETLEVYVQAFTAAGPGATGVSAFEATASTGPMYGQSAQPQSFVPGSDPLDPPNDQPVFGPDSVPTVVEPDPPVNPPVVPPVNPPVAPTDQLPATGGSSGSMVPLAIMLIMVGLALRLQSGRADRRRRRSGKAGLPITW